MPVGLESELSDNFDDVTMRQTHPMRVPVSMRVAQSHIRVTTVSVFRMPSNALSTSCRPKRSRSRTCSPARLPRSSLSATSTTCITCPQDTTLTSSSFARFGKASHCTFRRLTVTPLLRYGRTLASYVSAIAHLELGYPSCEEFDATNQSAHC